jgi:DNA-binding CsgD family transcriptional regulator
VTAKRSRHPALLERDAELRLLAASADRAGAGQGAAVVVEAAAGLGKTGLLAAAADLAAARSTRVLKARGGELESDLAYGVVRQLFEPPLAAASAGVRQAFLDGPAVVAAGTLGLAAPVRALSTDDPTGAVLHGLYWLAANIAAAGPVALLVDDLHWVDPASLRFLVYLARRLDSLPILLVAATRPAGGTPVADLVDALKRAPATAVADLAPLSPAAIAAMVEDEADGTFAAACHAATGGNPFLVRELLAALRAEGAAPDAAAVHRMAERVPGSLAGTILIRLGSLPPASVALARAVAVLGTDAPARHAFPLAGLDRPVGVAAADGLHAAGILRSGHPLEFVHPLVRAAVLGSIPPAARASLHRETAARLRAEGADPHRIAPHLLAADPDGDPHTVTTLREAAAGAVARGAPEAAVRFLRRALDEPPEPAVQPAVLAELGKAEVRTGEPEAAIAHLRAALAGSTDPRARAALAHDLAIGLIAPGHYRDAVGMLAEAAAAASGVDPELGLRLEAELQCAARLDAATVDLVAERVARLAAVPSGRTPGERMLLTTLAHWHMIRGTAAADVRAMVARAVDGGLLAEQPGDTGVAIDAVATLTVVEDFDRADRAFAAAFADVRARNSVIGFARLCCFHSILEHRRGSLAAAESDARSAIETGTGPGYRVARMAYGPLLDALTAQGRLDDAESALAASGLPADIPDTYMLNYVLAARGRLHLARGRVAEAVADLSELDRREVKWRAPNPAVLGYAGDLALAYHRAGDVDAATAVAERTLTAAGACGVPSAVGAALRTLGLVRGEIDLLAESVAVLEGGNARLQLALSLVELGAAIRRSGQRAEARRPLSRGMDLAHTCRAAALAERAREELVAAGSRPRRIPLSGVDALTASEHRIARLAADGMTNREIAQALFVTVRTVQVHLQHAYRKLGIESRTELPAALLGRTE